MYDMIKKIKSIHELIKLAGSLRKKIILFELFTGIVNNLILLCSTLIIPALIMHGVDSKNKIVLIYLILGLNLIFCVINVFCEGRHVFLFIERIRVNIKTKLLHDLIIKTTEIELRYFDDPDFYNSFHLASHHIYDAVYNSCALISKLITSSILLITNLCITAFFSAELFAVVLCITIISLITSYIGESFDLVMNKQVQKDRRFLNYNYRVFEKIDNIKEMHTTSLKEMIENNIVTAATEYKNKIKKNLWRLFISESTNNIINIMILNIFLLIYLAKKVSVDRTLHTDELMVIWGSSINIYRLMQNFVDIIIQVILNSKYFEYYTDFMKSKDCKHEGKIILDKFSKIEFRHVYFKYDSCQDYVLEDINFIIETKSKVCLVGMNASGKSTLLMLLLRLYEVTKGEILINGINIKSYDINSLYNNMYCMYQDENLLKMSILDNITLRESPENETIKRQIDTYLQKFNIMNKINSLEEKLKTQVGIEFDDNGTLFSSGERQKLLLLRAFLNKKDIMIFDEPTADIDALTEIQFYRLLNQNLTGDSVIYVCHRLIGARYADNILVFQDGKLIEQGNFNDLIKSRELFYKMYVLQNPNFT